MKRKNTFFPANKNLSELFSLDNSNQYFKFYIPDYQRQYSWTDKNLKELWEDLYEAFKKEDECYFLGSIVVVETKEDNIIRYDLIDGQQRITTFVIMMDVILKDFKEKLDGNLSKKIDEFLHPKTNEIRLILQSNPNYDVEFNRHIIMKTTFNHKEDELISEEDLKKDEPKYKYVNTAFYFYDKFSELDDDELNDFVEYIFNNVCVIKTICYDENFAIKMFQSLNDRGLELSNSDIFKSWLYSKCDKSYRLSFNSSWKTLVEKSNRINVTMDDFIVFYEYYKLKNNPKFTVVDELKDKLKDESIDLIISDLEDFMCALEKVFSSKDYTIFSLRYIPWKFYVITALASAFKVNYSELPKLFKLMQRYYYIAYISGANVNTIKQTSFNLIDYIVNKRDIEEIEILLNDFIYRKQRLVKVYDNLNGSVYGERFLKPLMLSVDYMEHEKDTMQFIEIDNKLHMDHILPKKYKNDADWNYISNHDAVEKKINSIGNMALLQWFKNEKALNHGLQRKLNYYNGYEDDGVTKIEDENGSGVTSFVTTKKVIEEYKGKNKKWTGTSINERKSYLIEKIEELLDISEEEKEIDLESENDNGSLKNRWIYKDNIYNNKRFINALLKEYIIKNNITSFDDIPKEIVEYQVYHRDFLSTQDEKYRYFENINGIDLYLSSVYYRNTTLDMVELFRKFMDVSFEEIKNDNVQLHNHLRCRIIDELNRIYDDKFITDEKNMNKANSFIQFLKPNWAKDCVHFELYCKSTKWYNAKCNMRVELHLEKRNSNKYLEHLNNKGFAIDTEITSGANVAIYNGNVLSTSIDCDFTNENRVEQSITDVVKLLSQYIDNYEMVIDDLIVKDKTFSQEDVERFLNVAEDDRIREMYHVIDEFCMNLGNDVSKNTTNTYIGYSRRTIFCDVHIRTNRITCNINTLDYDDPRGKVKFRDNVSWSNKNYISIYPDDDIDYVLDILKQSYDGDIK